MRVLQAKAVDGTVTVLDASEFRPEAKHKEAFRDYSTVRGLFNLWRSPRRIRVPEACPAVQPRRIWQCLAVGRAATRQ